MVEITATVNRPKLTPVEQERVWHCTAISECKPVDGGYRVTLVTNSPMQAFDLAHDLFAGDIIVFEPAVPYAWTLAALQDADNAALTRSRAVAVAAARAAGRDAFGTVA